MCASAILSRCNRAGDVIPQIVRVASDAAAHAALAPWAAPTYCEVCNSEAVREPGEVARRCTGELVCAAQPDRAPAPLRLAPRARHRGGWRSKPSSNSMGWGWLDTPAHIFRLRSHLEELLTRKGWQEKRVGGVSPARQGAQTARRDRPVPRPRARSIYLRARHSPCGARSPRAISHAPSALSRPSSPPAKPPPPPP